jgi:hypothetical protein
MEGVAEASATLTVSGTLIKTQPVSKLNQISGSIITFRVVTPLGQNCTYQWEFDNSTNGLAGPEYSGATSSVLTINPATAADQGSYNVIVSDPAGSATSATAILTIFPDTRRPTVAVTSPAPGARTANPIFKGTASDNAQVSSVTYWITNLNNGLTAGPSGYATLSTNGTTAKTWSFDADIAPGTNILYVQAADPSGNLSPIGTRRFFYEVPATLGLTITGSGVGTVTGAANNAQLNIGQTYALVAHPGQGSLFNTWTETTGGVKQTIYGSTLRFQMESNTVLVADFGTNMFFGLSGVYNGLFFVTNDVEFETAGMLANLVIGHAGGYSGRLLLDGATYSLAGTFSASGTTVEDLKSGIALTMILDSSAQINGAVVVGTNTATLLATRAVPSLGNARYTMLMLPPANFPAGDGYALILDHNGIATLSGGLADGTIFAQTVPVSSTGDVPVFANLYDKTGFLFGWIYLSNLDNSANGLEWIKKGSRASVLFPNGFTNVLQVEGSPWIAPAARAPAVNISSGLLTVSNADLNLAYQSRRRTPTRWWKHPVVPIPPTP